jgi:hypothetical protein
LPEKTDRATANYSLANPPALFIMAAHCSACCTGTHSSMMIVRNIIDYSVIISSQGSLASKVQAAIAAGWQPLGHPFRCDDNIKIIQALITYGPPHPAT